MVCFESLHGSRITLHGSRITNDISSKSQKRERLIIFILVNKKQYLRTLKSNIYHSNKREPPQFFHFYANSVFCHVLIHSVDQIHVLVVSRQKNVKQLSINISKLTVGVTHSISRRTTFPPNLHLVEEVTCFAFFTPCKVCNKLSCPL